MSTPTTCMSSMPRIAVIGGGPAGLTFARILQLHGLRVTVYEQDKTPDARSQGGSLDLHTDSGLLAMQTAGLMEQFKAKARPEGEQFRILDKTGKVFLDHDYDDKVGASQRPEIDRTDLRAILVASLEEGTIQWGRKLAAVVSGGADHHTLVFEDGAREEADIVIGADGAWSKVRPLVTDVVPSYCGITLVDIRIRNVDERYPHLGKLAGNGLTCILSPDGGLLPQRNSNGVIHISVALRVEKEWAQKEFAAALRVGPQRAREFLLSYFDGWNPELLDLIHNCEDDRFYTWPIHALPIGHRWSSKGGLTLVGDAAHLMSPYSGEGVNLAMLDAHELAMALIQAWKSTPSVQSLRDAIPAFEQAMWERAIPASRRAADNLKLAYDETTPIQFTKNILAMLEASQ